MKKENKAPKKQQKHFAFQSSAENLIQLNQEFMQCYLIKSQEIL